MLYVIYGTDTMKARKKASELVAALRKKQPDASYFKVTPENWSQGFFDEILGGMGLFVSKYIVFTDGLFAGAETTDTFGEKLKEIADSEHIFIVLEEKLKAAPKKLVEKHAQKVQLYDVPETASAGGWKNKKDEPNTFALADALIQKQYKNAWVYFLDFQKREMAAEEIHGVIWWQFKSLALVKQFPKSAGASGLSPFVHQKCVRASANWKDEELQTTLDRLLDMSHRAHRGELDFMSELEKFVLGK